MTVRLQFRIAEFGNSYCRRASFPHIGNWEIEHRWLLLLITIILLVPIIARNGGGWESTDDRNGTDLDDADAKSLNSIKKRLMGLTKFGNSRNEGYPSLGLKMTR